MIALENQIALAAISSWVIQRLKTTRNPFFRWIHDDSGTVNRTVSALLAAATTAGFTVAYTGSWIDGGTLTIQIPAASVVMGFVIDTVKAFVLQEGWYKAVLKPKPKPETTVINTTVSNQVTADEVVDALNRHRILEPPKP